MSNVKFTNPDEEIYIGCSFNFIFKVGVGESIVKAPRTTDHGSAV
jgi:hypothetical protein